MPSLTETIEKIQNNPLFVGSPTLLTKVDWEPGQGGKGGNNDYLIMRRSNESEDEPSQFAVLSAVGRVSEEKCTLLPCGGWTDRWDGKLQDVKARFTLVAPRHDKLLPLWEPTITAIPKLQDSKRSRASKVQHGIITDLENSAGKGLKFRHALYEVRPCLCVYTSLFDVPRIKSL